MGHWLVELKEVGIPIGAFALAAWVVIFIVKRLAGVIDKLSAKMDVFTGRVRDEHDASSKQHEKMLEGFDKIAERDAEMIISLGRINGYKK